MPGPKIQLDLFDIMLKFKAGRIALNADVVNIFRQVCIREEDWDFQRILWWENPEQELKEYWPTRITYGLTSAGYNAARAIMQCVNISNSSEVGS